MRTEYLVESSAEELTLTEHEANELDRLGEALASQKTWWGDSDETEPQRPKTVIRCKRSGEGRYSVRVSEAVGIVGVGELQLIISPKIPLPHLLFLLAESEQIPRLLYERSQLSSDDNFFSVIARWFVHASETLLRQGLASDYGNITDDLACARGRIHTVRTFKSILAGRPVIRCDFDRFGEDTSLNRVIKGAALRLLSLPSLPEDLQDRCRRIVYRLSDIGELRGSDLLARPDPLSRRYRDVHPLALAVLSSTGINMKEGNGSTWTFLFRTPDPVEIGVRNSLQRHLYPRWRVGKAKKILLGDRARSLNPDLVFADNDGKGAVGDVKYRLNTDGEIRRSDLNQVTTFATGFRSAKALVVPFLPIPAPDELASGIEHRVPAVLSVLIKRRIHEARPR